MFKTRLSSNIILFLLLVVIIGICYGGEQTVTAKKSPDAFEQSKKLGVGLNLSNALEAPNEGEWGVTLKEEYFKVIKDASFDSIRIPISWSTHALKEPPYTIEEAFLDRVEWAVKNAIKNDLYVMLNVQHYRELMNDPNDYHVDRFLGLWKQIAERFKDYPDSLMLEPMNEPGRAITPELWNDILKKTLLIIRKSNPHKTVVIDTIDPPDDAVPGFLEELDIPKEDRNVIVSFHYYLPVEFTHQGAEWMGERSAAWLGTKWMGTDEEKKAVTDAFDKVVAWGKKNNRPINLGEFGAYIKADEESRMRWTRFIAKTAEERNLSRLYWGFCCDNFGVYDRQTNEWRQPLLNTLIPPKK